jgi:hypothetical protein
MKMRGVIYDVEGGQRIVLPVVNPGVPGSWPPSVQARGKWVDHFRRRMARETVDAPTLHTAVDYEWDGEHPYVLEFLHAAVDQAAGNSGGRRMRRRPGPPPDVTPTRIEEAYRALAAEGIAAPTQEQVAERLQTSDRTVRRNAERWPPL